MKNKGCLLTRPLMLKGKSSENFLSSKKGQILAVFAVWGSGVRKSFDFYCKRHVDPRRLSHFAWKLVRGVAFRSVRGKNKVTYRNEVSPLTQGLNYRSACDSFFSHTQNRHYSSVLLPVRNLLSPSFSATSISYKSREFLTIWQCFSSFFTPRALRS